jgi:hypothetical protein
MRAKRNACRILVGKPEDGDHWQDQDVGGWIILKWILCSQSFNTIYQFVLHICKIILLLLIHRKNLMSSLIIHTKIILESTSFTGPVSGLGSRYLLLEKWKPNF